jgi:hypothetical protein
MKGVRIVFPVFFTLVSLLLFSTTARATSTPHVFFVPTATGQGPCFSNLNNLTEFTYNGGSWSISGVFNGAGGVICSNSGHIASFAGGGKMYIAYFQLDSQANNSLFIISTTNTGTSSQVWTFPFAASSINAPTPDRNANVVGFTDSNGKPRIFYIGQRNGTEVLVEVEGFGSTWQVQPSLPTGATPVSGTAMAGYLFNTSPQVFFIGTDGHIHETYLTNAWLTADVTVASGAPLPISESSLLGYQFNSNGPVYFVAGDFHVHQSWWNGSSWHTNDVTALAGAPIVEAGSVVSPLMGYMFNGQPTINYVDNSFQNIDQMWWTGSQEKWNDWTTLAGVAPPAGFPFDATPLTGYAFGGQSTVFYVSSSDHELHETFWNGSRTQDILLGIASPANSPEPGLASAIF